MNFERPSNKERREGEQHERNEATISEALERAIVLRTMKNWLGQFMARHAAEDPERPLRLTSTRNDFRDALAYDRAAAEEQGHIEDAAALEAMEKRFADEDIIPPEAQTMKEIIGTLNDAYERMTKHAREANDFMRGE